MLCSRPAPALAAFRTPQKVDSIVRQGFWRLLRQAGLRTREGKPDVLRFPMHHIPRPFARAVFLDATLRPSGWLLRGGKAAVHLHSPTVAGAVGALRRFRPRTPFPFHRSALLNGHLLHRFGLGDVLLAACCLLCQRPMRGAEHVNFMPNPRQKSARGCRQRYLKNQSGKNAAARKRRQLCR